MTCPRCGKDAEVLDTRTINGSVRRRRGCPSCGYRFTTYEVSDVVKARYDRAEKREKKLQEKLETLAGYIQLIREGLA